MKKMVYTGSHPSWKYEGPFSFEEAYELITDKFYDALSQDNHKVYSPARAKKPRTCAICDKSEPKVTFKKEAHVIPACLGNRIFLSLEECDACNAFSGREFEDHLARMLEPERALYQLPSRPGTAPPKWTKKGGASQISWQSDTGFVLTSGGPNDLLDIKLDEERKELVIVGPAKPYKPAHAIKSLLHTCCVLRSVSWRRRADQSGRSNRRLSRFEGSFRTRSSSSLGVR